MTVFILFACVSFATNLLAQDFTDIQKRKPFTINGQLGAEVSTYISSPSSFSRPFSYFLSLSLNPSIYGISLPLNFSLGGDKFSFSHPFNIMEFTPSYKWIKAYIGRTSMFMSQYGLSGHSFDGIGIELTPHLPFSFSAMYGRLQKETRDSLTATIDGPYRRMAYAFKVGVEYKKQSLALHFFHAKDIAGSHLDVLEGMGSPKQNITADMQARFSIISKINAYFNGALSWYKDLNHPKIPVRSNVSSLYSAFKTGIQAYGVDISYERVSPFFQSMGSYYFNNDFENIVVGYSTQIKQKVDLSARIGWQRDDLRKEKQSRMNRLVADANIRCMINEHWNLGASYSNFTTNTRMKPLQWELGQNAPVSYVDTLVYRQMSQQAQFDMTYTTGNNSKTDSTSHSNKNQTVNLTISFQESRSMQENSFSDYVFASLSHNIRLVKDYTLSSAIQCNTQILPSEKGNSVSASIGPSISANKGFLKEKNLNVSLGMQYYMSIEKKTSEIFLGTGIYCLTTRIGYTLKKKHKIDLLLDCRQRHSLSSSTTSTSRVDFNGTIRYSYSF